MIDENCVIYQKGKGFCWCPSEAWGVADFEVCKLCQIKNAQIVEKIGLLSPDKSRVTVVMAKSSSS